MGGTPFRVRDAVQSDVAAIVSLVNGAYRGDHGRVGWTSERELVAGARIDEAGVVALVDRPRGALLVMEERGEIVACVHLGMDDDGTCHVGMLSVSVARQASGMGRTLLAHAEERARTHLGARRMHLHVVSVRGELIAWYERRGYRRTGERVAFDTRATERILGPSLEFEVLERAL